MRAWLNSTLLLSLALAPGCLAHERDATTDGGPLPTDAAPGLPDHPGLPLPDAGPAILPDTGPPAMCAHDETSIGVRIEPVTSDVMRCAFAHAEHASLTSVEAAPADAGLRLHFDLCPGANADCRCDVVVTNVGEGIAETLGPDFDVTVDVAPGEGFFPGAYVAITKVPTCECDGCGCSEPLYLYAGTQPPDFAQHVPAPMAFSTGAAVCPAADCDLGAISALHARGDGGEAEVAGHTQIDVGSVHVRAIRWVEVFAPCAACAGCDTPTGAWIAWVTSVRTH